MEAASETDDSDQNYESGSTSSSSSSSVEQKVLPDVNELLVLPELRNRQRLNLSLFQLTAEKICDYRGLFCRLFESDGFNIFEAIPKSLRTEIIKTYKFVVKEAGANDNCRFTLLLLNEDVTSVTFSISDPVMSNKAKYIYTDLWLAMTMKCPNIQKICEVIKDDFEYPDSWQENKYRDMGWRTSFIALHFTQLQVLEMPSVWCGDDWLEMLAGYLPKLRILQVHLNPYLTSGITALAKLKDLEEFVFVHKKAPEWTISDVDYEDAYHYILCLRLLPRLQVCGFKQSFELHVDSFPGDLFRPDNEEERQMPSQLELKQICVNQATDISLNLAVVALPKLETLYLQKPAIGFRFSQVKPLPSLTELALYKIEEVKLEEILTSIGHQLHKLSLYKVEGTLHLDLVFRMCPKLQVLYISDDATLILPGHLEACALSGITEFGYTSWLCGYGYADQMKTSDLLQILRAAPNLRILRLYNFEFCYKGEMDICEALEQKTILQDLEKLVFCFNKYPPDEHYLGRRIQKDFFSALGCMIRLCPKLVDVKRMDHGSWI